ncbi:MAG: acyl-CoA thioesterase [Thermoplasmatota archaeon]
MHVQRVPVRFRDIDALDHVNHAVVLTYCETVRCDWAAAALGIKSMREMPFILASAHVEYRKPIPKVADVEVTLRVPRIGTKSWDFEYDVGGYALATTVQVAYDYGRQATIPIPATVRSALESLS